MKNVTDKRLVIFGLIMIGLLIPLSVVYYFHRESNWLIVLMMTPALSVVLTRIITKEGVHELYLKPHFKGNIKWYLAAYILTPFVSYTGAVLYFLIFRNYNPLGSDYALENGFTSVSQFYQNLVPMILLAILINPLMGIIQCFGEEFAWRGYLLPKLCKKMVAWKAALLTGVIWGVWHSPIIAMGYNYGSGHPAAGILAMIVYTTVLGTISAFLFFKTKSIWLSVVFHAAINALDLFLPSTLFISKQKVNPFIGPNLTGLIGGSGLIVVAILCFFQIYKDSKRNMAKFVPKRELL
jgi:uncharacterized protein